MRKIFLIFSAVYFLCTPSTTVQAQDQNFEDMFFLKRLWYKILTYGERKKMRNCLEANRTAPCECLRSSVKEKEEKEETLKEYPMSFYYMKYELAKRCSSGESDDTLKMALYLAVIDYIVNNNLATRKDAAILNPLTRDGTVPDLYSGGSRLQLFLEIDRKWRIADSMVGVFQNQIYDLDLKIQANERKLDSLRKIKVSNKLTIKLNDLKKQGDEAAWYIKDFINESNMNSVQKRGNAELKAGKNISSPEVKIDGNGQKLGFYCEVEIQKSVQKIAKAILDKIVSLKRKDSATVSLTITGKADGWGHGKIVRKYTGKKVDSRYFLKENDKIIGNIRSVVIENRDIYNIELAFLRAYCVYEQFYEVLNGKVKMEEPTFYASEYKQTGPQFRGIELEVKINNLFEHHQREIDSLKRQIDSQYRELGELRKQLDEWTAEKIKYENWKNNLDRNNPNSMLNQEILKLQNR